jgi:Probable Zinc-ribbon domain
MEKRNIEVRLEDEWDASKNNMPFVDCSSTSRSFWWTCAEGHQWKNSVSNRLKSGQNCPYCAGRKAWAGYNDLGTTHQILAETWNYAKNPGVSPQDVTAKSQKNVWWTCGLGHEFSAVIRNRVKGSRCPYCTNRLVLQGFNDLATLHPEVSQQWHPSKNDSVAPTEVTPHNKESRWWLCDEGHEWLTTSSHRIAGTGCPYCARVKVLPGYNDLSSTHPHIARLWNDDKNEVRPSIILAGSSKKYWWLCESGEHTYECSVDRMTASAHAKLCEQCEVIRKSQSLSVKNLATDFPAIAASWNIDKNEGQSPHNVPSNSRRKAWWICACGHEWSTTIKDRVLAKNFCPQCDGKRQKPHDSNSLAIKFPAIAQEWHPTRNGNILPSMVTYGSSLRVWWLCSQKHEWNTRVDSRTTVMSECPQCQANRFSSKGEQEVYSCLKQILECEIIKNARNVIYPYELDIYIPDLKFAIEFNGVYWHSEASGKNSTYHQRKVDACREKGIELYQIWEDDWITKKAIIMRNIAHKCHVSHTVSRILEIAPMYAEKIGARTLDASEISYQEASQFLDTNHIQGKARGTSYYGLFDSDAKIRSVLVIKRSGKIGEYSIERYASAGTIVGGFTKLLSYAEKNTPGIKQWVTFADQMVSNGSLYENNGFYVDKILLPDYKYLVSGKRVHKFNYRLKRFQNDVTLTYEEGKTEKELAAMNNLWRVWDSGKIRYVKPVEKHI